LAYYLGLSTVGVSESYFKKETSIYKVIEAKFGKNMDRREKIDKRNQSYKR